MHPHKGTIGESNPFMSLEWNSRKKTRHSHHNGSVGRTQDYGYVQSNRNGRVRKYIIKNEYLMNRG